MITSLKNNSRRNKDYYEKNRKYGIVKQKRIPKQENPLSPEQKEAIVKMIRKEQRKQLVKNLIIFVVVLVLFGWFVWWLIL